MSIKIQVAMCKDCNGYYCAAPLEKKDVHHPEIIDHFFYHGEPWFTLDKSTFAKFKNYKNTEIIIVDLHQHQKQDQQYCRCIKKKAVYKKKYTHSSARKQKEVVFVEKNDADTDIYFKDLYYTYNNFHGLNNNSYSNSNRKFH
jgi:hypothetical protein